MSAIHRTLVPVLVFFCSWLVASGGAAQVLRLVVEPERNAFELRSQYKNVTDFLAEKLGQNVYLEVLPDYTAAADWFAAGRADGGFLGGYAYLAARSRAGVEPLARPAWVGGGASCRGVLVSRRDSGIETVAQMRGVTLAVTGPGCTTGYFFPFFYLGNCGVRDPGHYFGRVLVAGEHDTVAWSVFTGESQVGALKDHVLALMAREHPGLGDELQVLARSSPMPSVCFAVRGDLDPALRDRLRFLLLEMDKVDDGRAALARFGAQRFIPTVDADYGLLRAMLAEYRRRGVDLDRPLFGEGTAAVSGAPP